MNQGAFVHFTYAFNILPKDLGKRENCYCIVNQYLYSRRVTTRVIRLVMSECKGISKKKQIENAKVILLRYSHNNVILLHYRVHNLECSMIWEFYSVTVVKVTLFPQILSNDSCWVLVLLDKLNQLV